MLARRSGDSLRARGIGGGRRGESDHGQPRRKNGEAAQQCGKDTQTPHGSIMHFPLDFANHDDVTSR